EESKESNLTGEGG
nr:hypothetical protein [Tanacetum cinerariifolium]